MPNDELICPVPVGVSMCNVWIPPYHPITPHMAYDRLFIDKITARKAIFLLEIGKHFPIFQKKWIFFVISKLFGIQMTPGYKEHIFIFE